MKSDIARPDPIIFFHNILKNLLIVIICMKKKTFLKERI